eukprot:1690502-Amphidinium_carterae.1
MQMSVLQNMSKKPCHLSCLLGRAVNNRLQLGALSCLSCALFPTRKIGMLACQLAACEQRSSLHSSCSYVSYARACHTAESA